MNKQQIRLADKTARRVRELIERHPEGVAIGQITSQLLISSTVAKMGLSACGAELQDKRWFIFDTTAPAPEKIVADAPEPAHEPCIISDFAAAKSEQQDKVIKALIASDGATIGRLAEISGLSIWIVTDVIAELEHLAKMLDKTVMLGLEIFTLKAGAATPAGES